jgi:hypothetical protein
MGAGCDLVPPLSAAEETKLLPPVPYDHSSFLRRTLPSPYPAPLQRNRHRFMPQIVFFPNGCSCGHRIAAVPVSCGMHHPTFLLELVL